VRWGVEHLYYELCRRYRNRSKFSAGCLIAFIIIFFFIFVPIAAAISAIHLMTGGFITFGSVAVSLMAISSFADKRKFVKLDRDQFRRLYDRWIKVHGQPKGVIIRREPLHRPQDPREIEPDLGDYSFDRAVICDRARTVDLLLANNFHFENNCAILSVEGYPAGPFETVRAMLKRNPRLVVYTLHDATPAGCQLAHRLATDPDWFAGWAKVVDVGLRPIHGERFAGSLLSGTSTPVPASDGITTWEASWLSRFALEVAAIRPEQVLKRLFKAINLKIDPEQFQRDVIYLPPREKRTNGDSGAADSNSGVDTSDTYVALLGSDADDSSGPADSFG
jgi:hypothetical protein